MANLSVAELKKREWRIDLFKSKILKNEFFETDIGKVKIIETPIILDNLNLNNLENFGGTKPKIVFMTDKGKELKLTNFKKNKEFGGGGGSGAGGEVTALAECAFCVVCSSYLEYGHLLLDYDSLNKIKNSFDIGKTKLLDVINFLKKDDAWLECTVKSAEKLTSMLSGKYIFHRDSVFFNEVYNVFSNLLSIRNKDKLRISNDKWNPGDVWVQKVGKKLGKFDSIEDYNAFLEKSLKNKEIFGVSLKKTSNPKIKQVKFEAEKLFVKQIIKPKSAVSSKDVMMEFIDGTIAQIRTFNTGQDVQMEIKGKTSAHGKIGFGNIKYFFNYFKLSNIPSKEEIIKMNNEEIIKIINDFYKQFNYVVDLKEFLIKTDFNDFKISKIQAICIASELLKSNEAATEIIHYAMSKGGVKGLFEPSTHYKIS